MNNAVVTLSSGTLTEGDTNHSDQARTSSPLIPPGTSSSGTAPSTS